MTARLVPDWYLIQQTPVGARWIYQAPDVLKNGVSEPSSPGGVVELVKGCLVADHKLAQVTYRDRTAQVLLGAAIKDEQYVSEAFPATITADEWRNRCTCGDNDTCTWCNTRYGLYETQYGPRDGAEHTLDFSAHVELPGGVDEHPEYPWMSETYSRVLFSDAFHHLRPGTLINVRDRLVDDLEALPNVSKVYNQRDFSVYVVMQWDEPQTAHRPRTGTRGRKLKGTETYQIKAIESCYEIPVPYSLTGQTKAEAVGAYIALRDKWVAFFREAEVRACSHCNGYGYITPKKGR